MKNALQVFSYEGTQVRTVLIDGEVWFVAKDVCNILELSDVSMATRNLDEDEKGTSKVCTPGWLQEMTIISEPGLYGLVFRSNKPEAKQFTRWVKHEVLPQIHHTGGYSTRSQISLKDNIEAAKIILEIKHIEDNQLMLALDRVYRRCAGFSMLEVAGIELIAPTKHQLLTPTEIGQQYGISAIWVNQILAGAGYQHKIGDKWEPQELGQPYAVMQDTGKAHSDGTPIRQLKWDSSILEQFEELIEEAS